MNGKPGNYMAGKAVGWGMVKGYWIKAALSIRKRLFDYLPDQVFEMIGYC
jgi:hypothetical protein